MNLNQDKQKQIIEVVCAVIIKDHKVFVTQRGYGSNKGKWEFPGGKFECGKDADLESAVVREIREELATDVAVEEFITQETVDVGDRIFHLNFFKCSMEGDAPTLLEHMDAKWVSAGEIENLDWLDGDRCALSVIISLLS